MSARRLIYSSLLLGCGALAMAIGFGQVRAGTVLTDSQATYGPDAQAAANRGAGVYSARCASCHGPQLGGGGHVPALHGEGFMDAWRGLTMRALYSRTLSTMPWNDPGTLSENNTLDVVAFIAKENNVPFPEMVSSPDQLNDLYLTPGEIAATQSATDEVEIVQGAQIYTRCAACHLPTAAGVPGAFPPLQANLVALANTLEGRRYLALAVSKGLAGPIAVEGHSFNGAMPPQQLDDRSIAAVLNHLVFVINKSKDHQAFVPAEIAAARANGALLRPAEVAKMRPTSPRDQ